MLMPPALQSGGLTRFFMNKKQTLYLKISPWLPGIVSEITAIILCVVYTVVREVNGLTYFELIASGMIPFFVPVISMFLKKPFPTFLAWIAALFVFLAVGLESVMDLYNVLSWWDLMLHASSGLMVSGILFIVLVKWGGAKLHPAGFVTIMVIAAFGIAGFWEIIEFVYDLITGSDTQCVAETGVADTMEDMLISLAGDAVFFLLLLIDKFRGYKFFGRHAGFYGFERKESELRAETAADACAGASTVSAEEESAGGEGPDGEN